MCTQSPAWNLPESLAALTRTGDETLVAEIIAIFQEDTTRRLRLLQQAFEARDSGAVGAQAHAMKGSASQLGAECVASCCREIERCAAGSQFASLGPLIERLQHDFQEVCHAMVGNRAL